MYIPELSGLHAVVTGASRGIGRAITDALLLNRVQVTGIARSRQGLQAIEDQDSLFRGVVCDLANAQEREKTFTSFGNESGIDILIHCAGAFEAGVITDLTDAAFCRLYEIHVTAAAAAMRHLWPSLSRSAAASVVLVSSLAGAERIEKFPTAAAYTASKMGLTGLMEVAAAEGRAAGIRVNGISPGAVDTDMLRNAYPDMKADFTPDQVANFAVFYASPLSAPVSGTNVVLHC